MKQNDFYLRVADALAGCQLLEQALRLYIASAHSVIRRNLPDRVAYRFSDDDCAGASLGQLINKFKRLSVDEDLIAALNEFKGNRNKLAHQAIVSCVNLDGELDAPPYGFMSEGMNIDEWLSDIKICADVLGRRVLEAEGVLDFDSISDAG